MYCGTIVIIVVLAVRKSKTGELRAKLIKLIDELHGSSSYEALQTRWFVLVGSRKNQSGLALAQPSLLTACPTWLAGSLASPLIDKLVGTQTTLDRLGLQPGQWVLERGPGPGRLLITWPSEPDARCFHQNASSLGPNR